MHVMNGKLERDPGLAAAWMMPFHSDHENAPLSSFALTQTEREENDGD